jgi:trehalose/maltose hydrolase-like predicted phosphorylase
MKSLFAPSNGHLGLRGNLDEGEPYARPGTFPIGFYEAIPAVSRRQIQSTRQQGFLWAHTPMGRVEDDDG